jgi:methionine synthase II (cobalamin-independent)
VIAEQERAGLDILTNGDYHLDEDFAGRSWHHYPLQRWKGLEHEELQYERSRDRLLEFAPGTLMNEIESTWRWPRVVGKVEHDPRNPLEYAKLWRIAQARSGSGKPVKFGSCSSQVLSIFLDSHTSEYDLEDKKQLIWDMATAMNTELRQLAAAGAKVIQIEEPTIHFVACFYPDQTELLDFLVDAFNHEVEGLDDVELWIHTCWGNPNMQKVYTGESYANSIEIYLERLKGDVVDRRGDREQPCRDRPLQAIREPAQEEGRGRRRQPPNAAGRHAAGRRRPGPTRAGCHPGRQAHPVHGLRLRPAGVQPNGRVLQDDRHRSGAEHRPEGARVGGALRSSCGPRAADGRVARLRAADAPAVALDGALIHGGAEHRTGARHGHGIARVDARIRG